MSRTSPLVLTIWGLALVTAVCIGVVWSHPYPVDANCDTPSGYQEISNNAQVRIWFAAGGMVAAAAAAVACLVHGFSHRRRLGVSLAGSTIFGAAAVVLLALLIASSLYCQN